MKAKFKILSSREVISAPTSTQIHQLSGDGYLGTIYDVHLDDADGVSAQYRVSIIQGLDGDIWTITALNDINHVIEATSRFGKKIVDFIKLDISKEYWYNEQ